jgi:hypothetical protein
MENAINFKKNTRQKVEHLLKRYYEFKNKVGC